LRGGLLRSRQIWPGKAHVDGGLTSRIAAWELPPVKVSVVRLPCHKSLLGRD